MTYRHQDRREPWAGLTCMTYRDESCAVCLDCTGAGGGSHVLEMPLAYEPFHRNEPLGDRIDGKEETLERDGAE